MPASRLRKAWIIVLVLLGLLAVWWLASVGNDDADPKKAPASDAAETGPSATGSEAATPLHVGTGPDAPRLPPELDDLRIRAESGDHVAGCRLGARLV